MTARELAAVLLTSFGAVLLIVGVGFAAGWWWACAVLGLVVLVAGVLTGLEDEAAE